MPQHKRLFQRLPQVLQPIGEFKALTQAEQKEWDGLWEAVEDATRDLSILTATEAGLTQLEKPLGIVPKGTATPEERRFVLLARYNEQLPFTRRVLEQQLENLCGKAGYFLEIDPAAKTTHVLVALVAKANFDEVKALLERVLPCNMVITLGLKYNQHHTLGRFTHAQLGAWKQEQLRNEVLTIGTNAKL